MIWTDMSPKKIYKWKISTWKTVGYIISCTVIGKCKLNYFESHCWNHWYWRVRIPNVSEDEEQLEILEVRIVDGNAALEALFSFSSRSHIPAHHSATPPPVVPGEMVIHIHAKICTWKFTTALHVGAKNLSAIWTDEEASGGITRPHEPKATESQSIVEGSQGVRLNERRYTDLWLYNSTHVITSQKPVQSNIEQSSCFWKVGNELTAQRQ